MLWSKVFGFFLDARLYEVSKRISTDLSKLTHKNSFMLSKADKKANKTIVVAKTPLAQEKKEKWEKTMEKIVSHWILRGKLDRTRISTALGMGFPILSSNFVKYISFDVDGLSKSFCA